MRVILSANMPYYVHAAAALDAAGLLDKYLCSVTADQGLGRFRSLFPQTWREKLDNRKLPPSLDQKKVRSIWLPELLRQALRYGGVTKLATGDWVANVLFDIQASSMVANCEIFHFVSSVGLYSARKAKSKGAIVVCDARAEHRDFLKEIVEEESKVLGIRCQPLIPPYLDRIKAEYDLANYIIVPSVYTKNTFVDRGFSPHRIYVVPYGVDTKQFAPNPVRQKTAPEKGFRVVYVGQIVPRKGVHYLVDAFAQVRLPDTELLLVGRVDATMNRHVKHWLENTENLRVLGHVPMRELHELYDSSSVFVLPSVADSFGLVCLEAMASGLPVVVSENVGAKDLVREGLDGFVVPIRDSEALQERLLLLYEDPALREDMGVSARERAIQFSWERYESNLLTVYQHIAAQNGRCNNTSYA